MDIESVASYLPFFLVGAVALYFLSRVVKYGGFKAAMFGARIANTTGEVKISGKLSRTVLRVHALADGAPDKDVGIEVVVKSLGSYRMSPLVMSVAQTRELIRSLQGAIEGRAASTY